TAFFCVWALLFAVSVAMTIVWGVSMSAMGEMPMPGGWTMSMAWMRMPGQTWPGAAASFLGMWVVMMLAMMLPSLVPILSRYRLAVGRAAETRLGRLTTLVGVGYFFVWIVLGLAVFPLGVALAAVVMQQTVLARAVPIAVGLVVLIAGTLQFTAWKARHLACCREAPGRGRTLPADAGTAWRHGLRLGLHCSQCCAGPMAMLLVIGVMDLGAMAIVAAAITSGRLTPAGERVPRAMGGIVVGAGLFLIVRAAGLGCRIPRAPGRAVPGAAGAHHRIVSVSGTRRSRSSPPRTSPLPLTLHRRRAPSTRTRSAPVHRSRRACAGLVRCSPIRHRGRSARSQRRRPRRPRPPRTAPGSLARRHRPSCGRSPTGCSRQRRPAGDRRSSRRRPRPCRRRPRSPGRSGPRPWPMAGRPPFPGASDVPPATRSGA